MTRPPPQFRDTAFDADWGKAVEDEVNARTKLGLPPKSVVATTGLELNRVYQAAIERGILVSSGPMERVAETGIVLSTGQHVNCDVILWATGFRASLRHLAPLKLREPGGGIIVDGVHVEREPNLFLVGYGASASTLGATRAGRDAALAVDRALRQSRLRADTTY